MNESREISERLIDELAKQSGSKKPRTYREQARKRYLNLAKNKKSGENLLRLGSRQQLQYFRRNLSHIDHLLEMYRSRTNRCDDRAVSISQPYVRPIVQGKAGHKVEFDSKISVSLVDGIAKIDHLDWAAFNEGHDLQAQVESYKSRYGYYPEVVLADGIYGTRENRSHLKKKGIRFGGKPLGRPRKQTGLNAEEIKKARSQRRQDALECIPFEGKFGQGKNGYRLSYIFETRQCDRRGMGKKHSSGDEPADSRRDFSRLESIHCRVYFLAIFFRSFLVFDAGS